MPDVHRPVFSRAASVSSACPVMADRDITQHLQKKLEDEIKLRTSLEQEVHSLQDQLASVKESSRKAEFLAGRVSAGVQLSDPILLDIGATTHPSEGRNITDEPQSKASWSRQQCMAKMERQSQVIVVLKEEIKVRS